MLKIHQHVDLYSAILAPGQSDRLELRPERHARVQVVRGELAFNGRDLRTGDGAALSAETAVELLGQTESEILLFDLARGGARASVSAARRRPEAASSPAAQSSR